MMHAAHTHCDNNAEEAADYPVHYPVEFGIAGGGAI